MKNEKSKLKALRIRSFIIPSQDAESLRAGYSCPAPSWDNVYCESIGRHGNTCVSTGNTDDPTGWSSGVD